MSELPLLSIDAKDIDPKKITFPELFRTSEIIFTQEKIYSELTQIALEQTANPNYPHSEGLYEQMDSYLQTFMNLWVAKLQIVTASCNMPDYNWKKGFISDHQKRLNDPNNKDTQISLFPKEYSSYYGREEIGIYITNNSFPPSGACSIKLQSTEGGVGITTSNLDFVQTNAGVKYILYSSRFDGKHHHVSELQFGKIKKGNTIEMSICGEEKFEYPYKTTITLPPEVKSSFQLYDIQATDSSVTKQE